MKHKLVETVLNDFGKANKSIAPSMGSAAPRLRLSQPDGVAALLPALQGMVRR